jgi:hypothetical protein
MNANLSTLRASWTPVVFLAACSLLTAACGDDGPTAPSAPTVRPTATPLSTPNVAGTWRGTYRPGSSAVSVFFCGSNSTAEATFTQNGARVSGSLRSPGGGAFVGQLRGTALSGTVTDASGARAVSGTADNAHVSIRLGRPFCPNARLDLSR